MVESENLSCLFLIFLTNVSSASNEHKHDKKMPINKIRIDMDVCGSSKAVKTADEIPSPTHKRQVSMKNAIEMISKQLSFVILFPLIASIILNFI